MTYATGQIIAAANYMGFRGSLPPSNPYVDVPSATNKVAALIGIGYGARGYGQSSTSLGEAVTSNIITASLWNQLYSAISTINTHTGSGLTVPSAVSTGDVIQANDGTSGRPDLATIISTLDSSRLSYSIGQMGLTSVLSSVRTTTWNTSVYHEFTVTFSNEDSARFFFNSGGQVYLAASRTGGSSTNINSSMSTLLSDMGTIKIGAQATTYTGTGGTAYPIGYYGLTGTYQTLFVHLGTTFGYSTMSYTVQARSESIVGSNGGNGSVVRIRATFATNLPPSYHSLDGTLTSSISQLKAGGALTISSPTYSTTSGL